MGTLRTTVTHLNKKDNNTGFKDRRIRQLTVVVLVEVMVVLVVMVGVIVVALVSL